MAIELDEWPILKAREFLTLAVLDGGEVRLRDSAPSCDPEAARRQIAATRALAGVLAGTQAGAVMVGQWSSGVCALRNGGGVAILGRQGLNLGLVLQPLRAQTPGTVKPADSRLPFEDPADAVMARIALIVARTVRPRRMTLQIGEASHAIDLGARRAAPAGGAPALPDLLVEAGEAAGAGQPVRYSLDLSPSLPGEGALGADEILDIVADDTGAPPEDMPAGARAFSARGWPLAGATDDPGAPPRAIDLPATAALATWVRDIGETGEARVLGIDPQNRQLRLAAVTPEGGWLRPALLARLRGEVTG